MSAPVKRIDEVLALPHSVDDFKGQEVPPSDDDSWLDNGEEELNSALMERQKEMELYELKHKKKGKAKEDQDTGPSSGSKSDEFDPSDIAKTMQAFVNTLSSYKGAEAPEDRLVKLYAYSFNVSDMHALDTCCISIFTREGFGSGNDLFSKMLGL